MEWKYKLWYDGGFLRDSSDIEYTYETEEDAEEEVRDAIEEFMTDWELEGCEDIEEELFKYEIVSI